MSDTEAVATSSHGRFRWWSFLDERRHVAFYLALVVAGLLNAMMSSPGDIVRSLLLVVVAPLSLLVLRLAPRTAVASSLLILVWVSLTGSDSSLAVTALAVVLVSYVAAEPNSRPVLLFVLGGGAVALSAYAESVGQGAPVAPSTFVFGVFGTALAIGLGVSLRLHRQALRELESRNRELEELRVVEARRAADDERTRIARELHDVVAHHVSAIIVRAQAAEHVRTRRPEETETALRFVIDEAGETLAALRRMLGLLRAEAPRADRADRAPQPGLNEIPYLVKSARLAGTAVDLTDQGEPLPLPRDVELIAYRVVQEGLTNAQRHARGAHVTVTLCWTPAFLEILVENTLPSPEAGHPVRTGGGHGLQGMDERLRVCGGHLEAGASDSGGWRVLARIPLGGRPTQGNPVGAGRDLT